MGFKLLHESMQTHPASAAPRTRRSSRRTITGTGFARAKLRQGPQVRSRVAVLGRDEEDQSVRLQRIVFAGLKEELGTESGLSPQSSGQGKSQLVAKVVGRGRALFTSALAGKHRSRFSMAVCAAWPNPSFKPSPNGKPPGPVCGALHSPQPGPGVLPSGPA